jgi:transposase-like protein
LKVLEVGKEIVVAPGVPEPVCSGWTKPQHGATTMKRTYEVAGRRDKRAIAEFLRREGQLLLPMVELVERTELAIDEVIEVVGRATIEAVLEMSAEGVAGPKPAGKPRAEGSPVWYGRQGGQIHLSDRKLRVERPRLRRRHGGEVEVPAYEAMKRPGQLADRVLELVLSGVSTRKYGQVMGEMAETVGVSKSAVSRETIEASERVLEELMERRLDGWDLLVIYLDGIQFGDHHVLGAVGVDGEGEKHVLGVREGASENVEVARALLENLVERGLDPSRRRLFVIDGSKALRGAITQVFGREHPVQRCRNHKLRNVVGHLPKDLHAQAKAVMRSAWKLDAKEGEQKLDQLARWLERDHPSAAASLREGMDEMFTINRLGLSPRLRRCLASTGVRLTTRRVTNWKNGSMALRWAAAAFVETEKHYRRILGYRELWMLRAQLNDHEPATLMRKAG